MKAHRLSQLDAFFVAYQEVSGIAMQLGAEFRLNSAVSNLELREAVESLVSLWPRLGQVAKKRTFGLEWNGETYLEQMIQSGTRSTRLNWRNRKINPFEEPPFQVLHSSEDGSDWITFRIHHAVADGISLNVLATRLFLHLRGESPHRTELTAEQPGAIKPSWRRLLGGGLLWSFIKYARWVARESRLKRSAPLVLRSLSQGHIDVHQSTLTESQTTIVRNRAQDAGVSAAMLLCAAWARAIHRWNISQDPASLGLISLEVPVKSLRGSGERVGNFISPLLLFVEASQPTFDVARSLSRQLRGAIRRRSYLAVPWLTAFSSYLPWRLFRATATDTTFSGFASSHFSWFDEHKNLAESSALNLEPQIIEKTFYTPVCLHMGAALSVFATSTSLQLTITHRLLGLNSADAAVLMNFVVEEACSVSTSCLQNLPG